jgi:hypothetical protein
VNPSNPGKPEHGRHGYDSIRVSEFRLSVNYFPYKNHTCIPHMQSDVTEMLHKNLHLSEKISS